jgi:hypothetical protein
VHIAADINNDKMIGLPEALYVLRQLASAATDENNGGNNSGTTRIILKGDSITVEGAGASAEGSKVTITSAGTYSISGTLTDGQILVNTTDKETVTLILNGVNIGNSVTSPLYIADAEETVIVLADNTENSVTDAASYIFENTEEDEPNAAVFSKSELAIEGNGSLTVSANYNDGIASKDGLTISGGNISVNAADDGIRGKDYLVVKDGNITVKAGGDGLKSDNEEDTAKGYISVEKGAVNVTSGGDAFDAQTNVTITDGEMTLTSGGGSNGTVAEDASAKGIKAAVSIAIERGTFTVSSADDALHSNGSLTINGGAFNIASGDDGIHADTSIEINGGELQYQQIL